MKKLLIAGLAIAVALAWYLTPRNMPDFGRKILVFSRTTEFRHDSIAKGIETLTELGRRGQYNVHATEDPNTFTEQSLADFHAIVFLNTTGDVLDAEQQIAMQRYIQAGGGFIGIHAAADTEWREDPWFWYQRLVGGVFNGHPENSDQNATLAVLDNTHAATKTLPSSWQASDEWYDYKRLSAGINVLMEVDETSYTGGKMGASHPITWSREFDGGRSFYTGLGHTESTYDNPQFQQMLLGGIEWAMGSGALDYSKAAPETWRFSRTVLDSGLNEPVKIAFSPDGGLYYLQRRGQLMRYDFDLQKSITVAEVPVFSEFESGMLGVAFDPDFANNRWVYLYRSTPRKDPKRTGETVLSRFVLQGDTLDFDSEQRLLSMDSDNSDHSRAAHAGGDMQFDAQGNLWLSTGDDTAADDIGRIDDRPGQRPNDAARSAANTGDLRGKILRIHPLAEADENGRYYAIPEGNLFANAQEGRPEIYAMGLRNPFTIAYDDRTRSLYWGEVGPDAREASNRGPKGFDEVNRTQQPGNFGWPYVIGDNFPYHYYDYENDQPLDAVNVTAPENRSRNNTGARILPAAQPAWIYYPYDDSDEFFEFGTGGRNALVAPLYYADDYADSDIKFPSWMDGKLILGEFMRNWLKIVSTDKAGNVESITPLIDHQFSSPLDMAFGPDGALYMVEYGSSWFVQNPDAYLSRIEYYAGENPPPVAIASVNKAEGAAPLWATLDASQSFDRGRDAGIASYRWELLSASGERTLLGTDKIQQISIKEPGEHTVVLTVVDDEDLAHSTQLRLAVGNERPLVNIDIAGNRSFYSTGLQTAYSVSVTDKEDGTTADGSIAADSVTVSFNYLGASEDLASVLADHQADPVSEGRSLVTGGSDCHGCHQVNAVSVGPSFTAVAQRYATRDNAAGYLAQVIAEGGRGQWPGNHAMPAHPALNKKQLQAAASYILSLSDAQQDQAAGLPITGTLEFLEHDKDSFESVLNVGMEMEFGTFVPGRYLLHASYADKGGDAPSLQGNASVVMAHPRQMADFLTAGPRTMPMSVPENVNILIVQSPLPDKGDFSYGYAPDVDLTGISEITVGASAMIPIFSGGILELRIDDPDSAAVAQVEVETALGYSEEKNLLSFDVSGITGVHTLYLGSPITSDKPDDKPPYIIVTLEFSGPALQ